MKRMVLAAAIMLLLAGCSPKFVPVGLDLAPPGPDKPGFINLLVDHMATAMDVAFARALKQGGRYQYEGVVTTPDERTFAYVFRSLEIRYAPYAFIYLRFDSEPSMVAWQNTSALERSEGVTEDGGMMYKGTYKLVLNGASFCAGDAWERPAVTDNDILVKLAVKEELRRHLYGMFSEYYTHPICMGTKRDATTEMLDDDLRGVRFYFSDLQSMNAFASSLVAGFPKIKILDRSAPPSISAEGPAPMKGKAPLLLQKTFGPGAADPEN